MNESEYADQVKSLGGKVHLHDGVWWLRVKRGYCRPVWRYRCLAPGTVAPKRFESLLGYSHASSTTTTDANIYCVMQRDQGEGERFDIDSLSSNRRSKIRRGLKRVEVKIVNDIDSMLPAMMEVVVEARKRTGDGLPVEYYKQHGNRWKQTIQELNAFKDNFFLVALKENIVVAYYHCIVVDKTMSITAAKSHSEYLRDYPNDALIFKSLDFAFNHWGCNSVLFGDYAMGDAALNRFKEGYGFKRIEIPKFESLRPGVGIVKRLMSRNR